MQNGTSFSFDFSSNGGWTEYYNNGKINQNDTEFTGMAGIADYGSNKGFSISNDANQGDNGESLLSKVWNSTLMRIVFPDEMGMGVSFNLVPGGFGYGLNIKGVFITRGKDAGTFSLLGTGSARAGFDIGGSVTEERGWFYGDAKDVTLNGLLGSGQDFSAGVGPASGSLWRSTDPGGNTTWFGIDGGIGFKAPFGWGVSGGQSITWPGITIGPKGISVFK